MDSRVDTTVALSGLPLRRPKALPVGHLSEDLYGTFAAGGPDLLGDRVLRDHIGHEVSLADLASASELGVRLGLAGTPAGDWAAEILLLHGA